MLFIINLILGIGLLVAGRRLFWLFVATAGFLTGVELTLRFFHGAEGVAIIVGIVVGILFAVLAMALQRIAIMVAGFFLGGAAFLSLAGSLGIERGELIIYIVGGVIGVVLLSMFFDWALIGISSFAGASLLVQTLALGKPMAGLAFVALFIAGIAIQFADKNREKKSGMIDPAKIIYLHGLESTSQSGKARQFAQKFPGMITPDFVGSFDDRMRQLYPILGEEKGWTIIGSSFGGLMGGVFTCKHPECVRKLILLAPALMLPEFTSEHFASVEVPTVLVHGLQDDVVPAAPVRVIAEQVFSKLEYISVEDGHRLHKAFEELDWGRILS